MNSFTDTLYCEGYMDLGFEEHTLSARETYNIYANCYGKETFKKHLFNDLTKGLLEACCHFSYQRWNWRDDFLFIKEFSELENWLDRPFLEDGTKVNTLTYSQKSSGGFKIEPKMWRRSHMQNEKCWSPTSFFYPESYSDWDNGKFSLIETHHGLGFDGELQLGYIDFYKVCFNKYDLGVLVPAAFESLQLADKNPERTSKFDWEAAFADVAAWLFFDADIPKVNARGVQAQIERTMADSFSKRGLPIPSEGILREKARILHASLRAFKT